MDKQPKEYLSGSSGSSSDGSDDEYEYSCVVYDTKEENSKMENVEHPDLSMIPMEMVQVKIFWF